MNQSPSWSAGLTPREIEVSKFLAEGFCNKEIATALCISRRTVEDHRSEALRKLGARNVADLVRKVYGIDSN